MASPPAKPIDAVTAAAKAREARLPDVADVIDRQAAMIIEIQRLLRATLTREQALEGRLPRLDG
jgi:hypothetical protein